MSFLTLSHVTFTYPNGHTAVEDLNVEFTKGESVAIVGQNGAGKTTTVKMMNGLLKPTHGDVIVDGHNTKDFTTAQLSKMVGYVFQNPDDQIFHNEVYKEIEFGPLKLGWSQADIEKSVTKAAELTGIADYLQEHPYNIPYSTRKFVSIASVIAMDPKVIILDEPTAGQDLTSLKQISQIIDHLVSEEKTVITITHDMEFVVNNFERVIVMANKRKVADGSSQSIFSQADVLEQSMLKKPHIGQLSEELQLDEVLLTSTEMVTYVEKQLRR